MNKKLKIMLLFSLYLSLSCFADRYVDFNSIPKQGTILMFAHQDDDAIWMWPWWPKAEKFYLSMMPSTPSYNRLVKDIQDCLNTKGYKVNYADNWVSVWPEMTDDEYRNWPSNTNVLDSHVLCSWNDNDTEITRKEIIKVIDKIEPIISNSAVKRIVTHNNWGEYGHQHHRVLNKAVRYLAIKYKKDVWVLGCDNSNFKEIKIPPKIEYTLGTFDKQDIFGAIRDIYKSYFAWTWYDSFPTGKHPFIKIVEGGIDRSYLLAGANIDMSFILPNIKANGSTNDITLSSSDKLSVTVELQNQDSSILFNADWWVLVCANGNWFYLDDVGGWSQDGAWQPAFQGVLTNLQLTEVLNINGLATGFYTFYFAVDCYMDAVLNQDIMTFDCINVEVI
jgi:hypothetical protein